MDRAEYEYDPFGYVDILQLCRNVSVKITALPPYYVGSRTYGRTVLEVECNLLGTDGARTFRWQGSKSSMSPLN